MMIRKYLLSQIKKGSLLSEMFDEILLELNI